VGCFRVSIGANVWAYQQQWHANSYKYRSLHLKEKHRNVTALACYYNSLNCTWAIELCSTSCYQGYIYKSHLFHTMAEVCWIPVCNLILVAEFRFFLLRGDRTVNHIQDKGISKGHRQLPLRVWDGKERQFEAQNWHNNSTRSFSNPAGTNNGYLPGPGQRYTDLDGNVRNSVVRTVDREKYDLFILTVFLFFF